MKRLLFALILSLAIAAFLMLGVDRGVPRIATPAYALCSTAEIVNNCCFKFMEVMRGEVKSTAKDGREGRATAVFRNCLYREIGCSKEMTEMKAKDYKTASGICRY